MPRKRKPELMSKAQLAMLLSAETGREISLRQVWAWYDRRANNGFPKPVVTKLWRGRQTPWFDPDEVLAWHKTYVPDKGGRPRAA
jgi:hypothetical protein